MNQAHSGFIEISELKKQIPNLDENKIKNLEARFTGINEFNITTRSIIEWFYSSKYIIKY